ncbi:MAG: amidohydrolase family protein [Cyanobacteria bacterium]|nr:amidohydrolase family protein [Cyanobacteriota bacterium]
MKGTVLKAGWVLPVTSPPIEAGVVVIKGGKIEAVGRESEFADSFWSGYEVEDLGLDATIVPGLISLHSHLDYSLQAFFDCQSKLFPWIEGLMQRTFGWTREQFLDSARYGVRQALEFGTTFIVDSSYTGQSALALAEAGVKGIVGLELFGLDSSNSESIWKMWLQRFDALRCEDLLSDALSSGNLSLTVAPHAPYTVCPSVWKLATDWALDNRLTVLAHLAETQQECNWLQGEEPEIDRFLVSVMKSHPDVPALLRTIGWKVDGASPVEFLSHHGLLASNLLLAHCIFVDASDLERLRESRVGIAHCPRSNARLRNGRAPFEEYLRAGVRFGLGTDSLSSNNDLNLLAEARFALDFHRCMDRSLSLKASDMMRLLTIDAARVIGLDDRIGSLEPGKDADLAVFQFPVHYRALLRSLKPDNQSALTENERSFSGECHLASGGPAVDPYELLVRGNPSVRAVYIDGVERLKPLVDTFSGMEQR